MNTAVKNTIPKTGSISYKTRWTEGVLPLLLLLCFIIATTLGLYSLSFLRTVLVSERGSELAMNASAVAGTVDRVLYERFGDIQWFANDGILLDAGCEAARQLAVITLDDDGVPGDVPPPGEPGEDGGDRRPATDPVHDRPSRSR